MLDNSTAGGGSKSSSRRSFLVMLALAGKSSLNVVIDDRREVDPQVVVRGDPQG